jgi:hypothetical protein
MINLIKKIQGVIIFLCLVLFQFIICSCSKVIEIPLEDFEEKSIVNSLINPNDKITIYLNKLSNITDSTFTVLENVKVKIYEQEELIWDKESENGICEIGVFPIIGKEYKLEFTDNKGNIISSKDIIPEKINITDATYLFPVYEDTYGSKFGKVTLSFQDELKVTNYYEIVILGKDSAINQTFNINSRIISLDNENDPFSPGTLLFTDELFNGEKLDLDIFVSSYDAPIIVLKNVSYHYYKYRKSIIAHFYNQNVERDDVYSLFKGDPVELYSNVSNGLGIFACYTQDIKECSTINE